MPIELAYLILGLLGADILLTLYATYLVHDTNQNVALLVREAMPADGATASYRLNKIVDSTEQLEIGQALQKASLDNVENAQANMALAQALEARLRAGAASNMDRIVQNIATRQEEIGRDRVGGDSKVGGDVKGK